MGGLKNSAIALETVCRLSRKTCAFRPEACQSKSNASQASFGLSFLSKACPYYDRGGHIQRKLSNKKREMCQKKGSLFELSSITQVDLEKNANRVSRRKKCLRSPEFNGEGKAGSNQPGEGHSSRTWLCGGSRL